MKDLLVVAGDLVGPHLVEVVVVANPVDGVDDVDGVQGVHGVHVGVDNVDDADGADGADDAVVEAVHDEGVADHEGGEEKEEARAVVVKLPLLVSHQEEVVGLLLRLHRLLGGQVVPRGQVPPFYLVLLVLLRCS